MATFDFARASAGSPTHKNARRMCRNFHANIGSSGRLARLPLSNSHYGMHMIVWFVPSALTGQLYSAPRRSLRLDPSSMPNLRGETVLPVLLPGHALLFRELDGRFTLELVLGERLDLSTLCVREACLSGGASLAAGQSVSWGARGSNDEGSSTRDVDT